MDEKISLPWDFGDSFGEINDVEWLCPDAYYVAAKREDDPSPFDHEYIIVDKNAKTISSYAKQYGEIWGGVESALVYPMESELFIHIVVEYEIARYRLSHGLPEHEICDIRACSVFGHEEVPQYFGMFPVPMMTPEGETMRHQVFCNGVYLLETVRGTSMLSVCYPIWACDLSDYARGLGVEMEYDSQNDINKMMGYLYFREKDFCVPIFELVQGRRNWAPAKQVDLQALMNALWEYHASYAATHNLKEQTGLNDNFGLLMRSVGIDFELRGHEDHLIVMHPESGTDFFRFDTD